MTIVINTCGQETDIRYSHFIYKVFTTIANNHPDVIFYIYGDAESPPNIEFPENLSHVQVIAKSFPLLGEWGNRLKLESKIKQARPDVLIMANEPVLIGLKIPQYLVIPGGDYINNGGFKKVQNIIRRNLQTSTQILTFTQATKDALSKKGGQNLKIKVMEPALEVATVNMTNDIQQAIKDEYTDGKEFFVCVVNEKQTGGLITLLKAYSVFKRRQKSNMKMFLIAHNMNVYSTCLELLNNYKYREDVIIKNYNGPEEQQRIIKSAYAAIYLSPEYYDGNVLEAMEAAVPALVPSGSSMAEIAADSALYFNISEFESLAEQLMLIFKDEDRRNKLITDGKNRSATYSIQRSANVLWESLAESINHKHLP